MTGESQPPSRVREWTAVLGGFAILAATSVVWLTLDRRPPEWDHANHLERVVSCAADMAAGDARRIVERSSFYPPLVFCAAALVYRFAPSDVAAAQSVVLLFLGVGMGAVYLLGRQFAGGSGGVLAALLFGSAPFVVFSSLRFQLDLPLASMVAVALVVLLRTNGFRNRGWSVLAGVVLGLGMVTKPPFGAFVSPPLALVAAGARSRRQALNCATALVTAAGLSAAWYGPRLIGLPLQISSRSFKQAAGAGQPDALTWTSLAFYPKWFVTQFGAVAVLLFVAGLILVLRRRQWFLLLALFPPFVFFELIQNKDFRYTLPLLPVAAVVAAVGFHDLRPRLRVCLGAAALAAAVVQVSATVAGFPAGLRVPGLGIPLVLASPPMRADWRHRELLERIARDSGGAASTVSVIPNYGFFSGSNFRYYAVRDGLPLTFVRPWSDYPLNVDYVILKTGSQGPEFSAEKPRRLTAAFGADPLLAAAFPSIGEFVLPDGSVATVRVRRPAAVTGLTADVLARRIEAGAGGLLRDFFADARDLRIGLEYDDAELLRGSIRRVTVTAASARVGEFRRRNAASLRVHEVRLVLDGLTVNPARAALEGSVEPLALRSLRIDHVILTEQDLQAFLEDLPRRRGSRVAFLDGEAHLRVSQAGPDVDLRLAVLPGRDGRPIVLEARAVRLGWLPVPDLLTGWIVRNYDPTLKWARLPVAVAVSPLRIRTEVLEVGSP